MLGALEAGFNWLVGMLKTLYISLKSTAGLDAPAELDEPAAIT